MKKYLFIVLCSVLTSTLSAQQPSYVFSNTEGKVPVVGFKNYHYVSFLMESKLTAYLTLKEEDVTDVEVMPKSKKLEVNRIKNTVSVTLHEPGYYMVRLNKKHRFFIFAEKPHELPDSPYINILDLGVDNTGKNNLTQQLQSALDMASKTKKTLYFPAGEYKTFPLVIGSNTHIFLDKDAVIKADLSQIEPYKSKDDLKTRRFIYIKDAENVSIKGLGSIDANGKVLRDKYGDEGRMRLMMIFRSKNVEIDGLMFKDPGSWNTQILCSEDITFKHVKLMNDIDLSNTDGFDPDASKRVLIEDCFAYCSDDNVAVKITNTSGFKQDVEDITVRGCVFLTKKSSLKVGTETRGNVMKNILFEDNDVIECDRGMALYVLDGANLQNIRYINNRFEENYPDAKQCGINFVVQKRNPDSTMGAIADVLIKDCSFEKAFPKLSEIKSKDVGNLNVKIENLSIGNKTVTAWQDGMLDISNANVDIQ